MPAVTRQRGRGLLRDERGVMVVLFAVVLPVLLIMATAVWDVGNWWTHRKHLQTKADAAVFAGGGVWGFPCANDIDLRIVAEARKYVGSHMGPGNQDFTGVTTLNPQVGGTPGENIHVVLNGDNWWDDDAGLDPADSSDSTLAGSICETKTLDVKATEENNSPLFGLIPFFPDIKRKARVEIREVEGLSGLLPISVRVPKPVSAAAVYYDEVTKDILKVTYFCEKPTGFGGLPAGLGGWTTYDPTHPSGQCPTQASFPVAPATGVVIATSFRPACNLSASPPITRNCFEDQDPSFRTVDDLCRQGGGLLVQCFYGTGTGASQTVQHGLQFIHGYRDAPPAVTDGPPLLRGAWLTGAGCTGGGYGSGYFASVTGSCAALLDAKFDLGSCMRGPEPPGPATICFPDSGVDPPIETRTPANTEVKYTLVTGIRNNDDICDFGSTCDLGPSWSVPLTFSQQASYAIALRVRLKDTAVPGKPGCSNDNFNGQCEWYYTAAGREDTQPTNEFIFNNPVQRSFMGDDDRSGPIKFLRLNADTGCNDRGLPDAQDTTAASHPFGETRCYWMEMGLKGAIAQDQDEPPIVFNLKASQSAALDCDPNLSNLKGEVVGGCSPLYRVNDFSRTPPCPNVTNWGGPSGGSGMLNPGAPYDTEWPPHTCVITQTGNPRQLLDGFAERFFGPSSPRPSCPSEGSRPAPEFVKGRNYWHDANNLNDMDRFTFAEKVPVNVHGNNLRDDDPRMIELFMTAYNSFTGKGNEIFPIVSFGTFYVTGYGTGQPGGGIDVEDPCDGGNSNASPGAGNKPPPDIVTESGGAYVWGHFIDNVVPSPDATPSDRLCAPSVSTMPCVPSLVE